MPLPPHHIAWISVRDVQKNRLTEEKLTDKTELR